MNQQQQMDSSLSLMHFIGTKSTPKIVLLLVLFRVKQSPCLELASWLVYFICVLAACVPFSSSNCHGLVFSPRM